MGPKSKWSFSATPVLYKKVNFAERACKKDPKQDTMVLRVPACHLSCSLGSFT